MPLMTESPCLTQLVSRDTIKDEEKPSFFLKTRFLLHDFFTWAILFYALRPESSNENRYCP